MDFEINEIKEFEFNVKRKMLHILLGVTMIILFEIQLLTPFFLFLILCLVAVSAYILQKSDIKLPLFYYGLQHFERPEYRKKFPFRGFLSFLLGSLLAIELYPKNLAYASILILSFGDSIACISGSYFKLVEFKQKIKKLFGHGNKNNMTNIINSSGRSNTEDNINKSIKGYNHSSDYDNGVDIDNKYYSNNIYNSSNGYNLRSNDYNSNNSYESSNTNNNSYNSYNRYSSSKSYNNKLIENQINNVYGAIVVSKRKLAAGSILGFGTAFFVALIFVSPIKSFVASFAAMFVEFYEWDVNDKPLDDNILIPLSAGAAVVIAQKFLYFLL